LHSTKQKIQDEIAFNSTKEFYLRAFSILELLLVLLIISILSTIFIQNSNQSNYSKIDEACEQILTHLKYTRHLAMIDNRFDPTQEMWFRSRWRIKFLKCRENRGIYYTIFSDKNLKGTPNKDESIKDPLSKKWLYVSNWCTQKEDEYAKVLLTKEFDISSIELSCNATSSFGEIIFDYRGKPYNKFGYDSNDAFKYALSEPCYLKIINSKAQSRTIIIQNETGFAKKE
jgi:competence protein ComGC